MFPHLQADSCAGIEKYLVCLWGELGPSWSASHGYFQDLTGGFQEINQPGLGSEEKSQFSLNLCTGQAGASCS